MTVELPPDIIAILCRTLSKSDILDFITMNKRTLDIALRRVFQPWVWYKRKLTIDSKRFNQRTMIEWQDEYGQSWVFTCGLHTALCDGNLEYYRKWVSYAGDKWDPSENNLLLMGLSKWYYHPDYKEGRVPVNSLIELLKDPRINPGLLPEYFTKLAIENTKLANILVKYPQMIEYWNGNIISQIHPNIATLISRYRLGPPIMKDAISTLVKHTTMTTSDYEYIVVSNLYPGNNPIPSIIINKMKQVSYQLFRQLAVCDVDRPELLKKIVESGKLDPPFDTSQYRKFNKILKIKGPKKQAFEKFFKEEYTQTRVGEGRLKN